MKSKLLIEILQKLDPSGEIEVCVGSEDIIDISLLPAYYDGKLQVLQRDKTKEGYDIVGVDVRSNGQKISISPYGLEYYVFDHHSDLDRLNITFDHEPNQYLLDQIEEWKKKAEEINKLLWRDKK